MKSLITLAALLLSLSVSAAEFEYKVIQTSKYADPAAMEQELNDLGKQGWELVSVLRHMPTGTAVFYRYHLKREK